MHGSLRIGAGSIVPTRWIEEDYNREVIVLRAVASSERVQEKYTPEGNAVGSILRACLPAFCSSSRPGDRSAHQIEHFRRDPQVGGYFVADQCGTIERAEVILSELKPRGVRFSIARSRDRRKSDHTIALGADQEPDRDTGMGFMDTEGPSAPLSECCGVI